MSRIVAGRRAVLEALSARPRAVSGVYLDGAERKALRDLENAARRHDIRVDRLDRAALDELGGGVKHQGAIAVVGEYRYAEIEDLAEAAGGSPLLVALDQITDPRNLGAIVRSAVALGADGVVVTKDRSASVTPVVVRASAGATEHAAIARVTNLARTLSTLADRGLEIVGLAGEGDEPLTALGPGPGGRVLVVGSEGRGLRRLVRERCDRLVRIDLPGPMTSLNASVAAAIALYEASRTRTS